MELLRRRLSALGAGAGEPVGEDLAVFALGFEGFEEGADLGGDVVAEHGLEFEAGEGVAADAAADEHRILVRCATHEAEVGVVGAAAAVRAAGHAEEDRLVFEAEFLQDRINLVEDARQRALGFAEAQAAGRQRHAGVRHFASAGEASFVRVHHTVLGEDGIDLRLLLRSDVGDDEVRVCGDDERQVQLGGDLSEGAAILRSVLAVHDAAHVHIDGAVELAVALLVPAEVVFHGVKVQRLRCFGRDARKAAHDFGAEAIEAHRLHGVFEASVLALGAVAVVALRGDDRFDGIDDVGALRVEQRLAEEGTRVYIC